MKSNRYRELHRYAVAGNEGKSRSVLLRLLEMDPEDTVAKQELERLEQGRPLLATLPTAQFHSIVEASLLERIKTLATGSPEAELRRQATEKLEKLHASLLALRLQLDEVNGSLPAELGGYFRTLKRLLRKRRLRARRKTIIGAGAAVLCLMALWGSGSLLRSHARQTAIDLQTAMQQGQWQSVCKIKGQADRGIYSLLYPDIKRVLHHAAVWMEERQKCYDDLARRLQPIREGARTVASLSLAERATIERGLESLPEGLDSLRPIWQQLCRDEQEKLDLLRQQELGRLQAPLPDWPEWTGDPAADAATLGTMLEELERRLSDFQDAVAAYHLSESLTAPLQERIGMFRRRADELEALGLRLAALSNARTLAEYTAALPKETPSPWYATANTMADARRNIPGANALRNSMANADGILPDDFVEEARRTFLSAGPTFTALNPANSRQVELLEDFFTTTTLSRRIYEVEDRDGNVAYAPDKPVISKDGDWLIFRRDVLDPSYRLGEDENLAWRTYGAHVRLLDANPLLTATGLKRPDFYNRVNLPNAMGMVLNAETSNCPILARAYIFDTLVRLLKEHGQERRIRLGLRFSPTLRQDIASFTELRDAVIGELKPGCWLAPSPSAKLAAERFQQWFDERKGHNYAMEIARNYGEIARVHPRYVGFVGWDGKLHTLPNTPEGAELWYVGEDGAIHHAPPPADGRAWERTRPFSPLFIPEKDAKEALSHAPNAGLSGSSIFNFRFSIWGIPRGGATQVFEGCALCAPNSTNRKLKIENGTSLPIPQAKSI